MLARIIAVVSICLIYDFSTMATFPSIPAAHFAFLFVFFYFVFVICSCFSGEPKQKRGRGLADRKLVQALQ